MAEEIQNPVLPRRSLHVTGAACAGNLAIGGGKLLMGLWSLSAFTCVSGLYTLGMVAAQSCALRGIIRAEDVAAQRVSYRRAGLILMVASLLYAVYSVRLFFRPDDAAYPLPVALGIATFTFTELTLNLRGVMMERKNHTPLVHALKTISLASSLICLVLTQRALLALASDQAELHPSANGFFGIVMGVAAALLGAGMLLRMRRLQQKEAQP